MIEKSILELGRATIAMAPAGTRIDVLRLRAELARAAGREARFASIVRVSGLSVFGLALVALALRIGASPEPLSLLVTAVPVLGGAIFSGLTLAAPRTA